MRQPLMLIPPAQAEILSDSHWTDSDWVGPAEEISRAESRYASGRWLDDDLPDEIAHSSSRTPAEVIRRRVPVQMQAA